MTPQNKPSVHIVAAARPNFMKAAPLWHALQKDGTFDVRLVHTGQHYDENMSGAFFRELRLPDPHYNLDVGSGRHGKQTAAVIDRYEALCLDTHKPDWVIVIGDVNSTAGCALAASKIGVRIAHLEAGLRSFDRFMPEEINRLVTDVLADILWTPSPDADENLKREGIDPEKIICVGNIMIDSFEMQREKIEAAKTAQIYGLQPKKYGVVTLHRPANVDTKDALQKILSPLLVVAKSTPLIWPLHPRAKAKLMEFDLRAAVAEKIILTDPLSYIPFMSLVSQAQMVLTDSGGVQEETTYLGIPCLTLRPNTERPITISEGTNVLIRPEQLPEQLVITVESILAGRSLRRGPPKLWDGQAAARVVASLKSVVGNTIGNPKKVA